MLLLVGFGVVLFFGVMPWVFLVNFEHLVDWSGGFYK